MSEFLPFKAFEYNLISVGIKFYLLITWSMDGYIKWVIMLAIVNQFALNKNVQRYFEGFLLCFQIS